MKPIIENLDIDKYHSDPTIISSTGLKELKKSTRHFIYYLIHGTKQKKHFDFGNAFELALIDAVNGTSLFHKETAIKQTVAWTELALKEKPELINPKSSKAYKDRENAFLNANSGKYIIDDVGERESWEALNYMIESCINDSTIKRLLTAIEYQYSFFWTDKETGLKLKTRPDCSKKKKNVIVDIKTTLDASPEGFARQAANLDYPIQAIMQIEGAIQSGYMERVDNYFWLAVEKTPPYNACIYEFQQGDIVYVYDQFEALLQRAKVAIGLIKQMKDNLDLAKVQGYGEQSENQYGIIPLQIPLYYR